MASETQDIAAKIHRVGYLLEGRIWEQVARLEEMEYELKQMEKDRDDIRQELEDTLRSVQK